MRNTNIPIITVIIPTTCEKQRKKEIKRAIKSIIEQKDVLAKPVIIVNGDKYDKKLLNNLISNPNTNVYYLKEGNLPKARIYGRRKVQTEYFCFLDDDDEYLPGALKIRYDKISSNSQYDVVVTNGYKNSEYIDRPIIKDMEFTRENPMMALTQYNWLASCSALFRSKRVQIELFYELPKYFEWTILALRLAMNYKIVFIDEITYRINSTLKSLSKSEEYILNEMEIINTIINMPIPIKYRKIFKKKLTKAAHNISEYYRERKDYRNAIKYYLFTIKNSDGYQYWASGRHIIKDLIKSGLSGKHYL